MKSNSTNKQTATMKNKLSEAGHAFMASDVSDFIRDLIYRIPGSKFRHTHQPYTNAPVAQMETPVFIKAPAINNINKISFMKTFLRKSGIFAVALMIANLFLMNNSYAQTAKVYAQNTSNETGTTGNVYDLTVTQGAAGTRVSAGSSSTSFTDVLDFTIDIDHMASAVSGNSFPVSLSVNAISSNTTARFRIQHLNSAGTVLASSTAYSSTFTTTGTQTATFSFAATQTWAATDQFRLSVEIQRGGTSSTKTITINTGNANSFVQYTIGTPTITSFTPASQCAGSSTSVVITGTNFTGATAVNFNGIAAASFTVDNSTQITATSPTSATTGTISITTPGGTATSSTNFTVNALPNPPTISAGGPTTFCSGSSVTLASSSGSSYLWSTGATTQSINVTASGSYTVKVTNASGCQSAASSPTVVTVNPLPTITVGTISSICSGSTSFTIPYTTTSGSPTTYSISGSGITTVTSGSLTASPITVNLSSPASGSSISFTLTVANANCTSTTVPGSVTVDNTCQVVTLTQPAQLIATISGDATICNGGSTPVTVTVSGGTAPYFINGIQQTGVGPFTVSESPTTTTTYNSSNIIITDSHSCSSTVSGSASITVNQNAAISSISYGATSLCTNATQVYTAQGVDGTNAVVNWYTGPGGTGTLIGTGTSVTYGPGTIYARVTADCGSPVEVSATISLTPDVVLGQSPASASYCEGQPASQLGVSASAGTVTGYQWYSNTSNSNMGGSPIPGETGASYVPPTNVPGIYYYYAVISGCNSVASDVAIITVYSPLSVGNDGSETDVTCNGAGNGSITLGTISGGNGLYTITWTGPNGYSGSGTTISGLAAGTYNYSVSDGLCDAATGSVVVNEPAELTAAASQVSAVTCNGAGNGSATVSVTGGNGALYLFMG